jgi:hypothetical protein
MINVLLHCNGSQVIIMLCKWQVVTTCQDLQRCSFLKFESFSQVFTGFNVICPKESEPLMKEERQQMFPYINFFFLES